MKKIISVLCLFLFCLSFAFAEGQREFDDKIIDFFKRDSTVFESEIKNYYKDPAPGQFGIGLTFADNRFISSEATTGLYIMTSTSNVGLNMAYTHNNINNKFGFRWNINTGYTFHRALHLGTDINWIFIKFRFDDSHSRTTHILDLSLGLGVNSDLYFSQKMFLIDPFGQFGLSFSFYNHWTIFANAGLGVNLYKGSGVPDDVINGGLYIVSRVGIRYNF